MKKYLLSEIPHESWTTLYAMFWRVRLECLPQHLSIDGLNPLQVETMKTGILVDCEIWFLPLGKAFETQILLCRPRFSRIEDLIPSKLELAEIRYSELDDHGRLYVEIA